MERIMTGITMYFQIDKEYTNLVNDVKQFIIGENMKSCLEWPSYSDVYKLTRKENNIYEIHAVDSSTLLRLLNTEEWRKLSMCIILR